ncbi:MAG: hypothetical protein DRQ44_11215 [Gammaproteobacteria bacterium]|nr:MAG: hypothetical protein DRQ44_11215 [Gammaproteobacteria bacterium]
MNIRFFSRSWQGLGSKTALCIKSNNSLLIYNRFCLITDMIYIKNLFWREKKKKRGLRVNQSSLMPH